MHNHTGCWRCPDTPKFSICSKDIPHFKAGHPVSSQFYQHFLLICTATCLKMGAEWHSCGGTALVAQQWWHNSGSIVVVAQHSWHSSGVTTVAAQQWWHSSGSAAFVTQYTGGTVVVAQQHWWHSFISSFC